MDRFYSHLFQVLFYTFNNCLNPNLSMNKSRCLKIFLFPFFLLLFNSCIAQKFGMNAGIEVFHPHYYNGRFGNHTSPVQHIAPFSTGLYLDVVHFHNDPPLLFGIFDVDELGFTWFFPTTDSVQADVLLINNGYATFKTVHVLSMISFHFSQQLLIPATFNDFLSFYIGYSIVDLETTDRIILPERSAAFPYSSANFDPGKLKIKKEGVGLEALLKANYELERFYLTAQYSFLFTPELFRDNEWRNGFKIGALYAFGK
jgi:hypothetical protein